MAGGTFASYDKVRPGVYVNFEPAALAKPDGGVRGTVVVPMELSWGATISEVSAAELLSGAALAKVGMLAMDAAALPLRLALMGASDAIVYRKDDGGDIAYIEIDVLTVGSPTADDLLTVTANYAGTFGNTIGIALLAVTGSATLFDVVTSVGGAVVDSQRVADASELVDNAFVSFDQTEVVTFGANAGGLLTLGTNGTVGATWETAFFTAAEAMAFNTLAFASTEADENTACKAFVIKMRDQLGVKCSAVMQDYDADYEGITSVSQGYVMDTGETAGIDDVVYRIAGLAAGVPVPASLSSYALSEATELSNVLLDDAIIAAIGAGKLVLARRRDGAICVESDVNTLVSYGVTKPEQFKKNRTLRILDALANAIGLSFATDFSGKVSTSDEGLGILRSTLTSLIGGYQTSGAIRNFVAADDLVLSLTEAGDSVIVNLAVQPIDAVEKLYMTVVTS